MQICLLVVIGMTGKEMTKMEGDLVAKKEKKHKKGKKDRKNAGKAFCVCLMNPKSWRLHCIINCYSTHHAQKPSHSSNSLHSTLLSFHPNPLISTTHSNIQ